MSEDGGGWVGGGPGRTAAGQSLRPNLHDADDEEKKKMRRRRIMMNRWVGGWWSRQDNRCPVLATQFAFRPLLNATLKPISHALTCFLLLLHNF